MLRYGFEVEEDEGALVVTVLDIPGVFTQADDMKDAKVQALDATLTMIAGLLADGEAIPMPGDASAKSAHFIDISTNAEAKIALRLTMRERGVKGAELARRLGWSDTQVRRLLDLWHESRSEHIDAAFRALDCTISVKTSRLAA